MPKEIGFYSNCICILLQDEFGGDDVDLYDDVIAVPSSEPHDRIDSVATSQDRSGDSMDTNGGFAHIGNNLALGSNHIGRRHQLYVGNLTWVRCLVDCKIFRVKYIEKSFFLVDHRSRYSRCLSGDRCCGFSRCKIF